MAVKQVIGYFGYEGYYYSHKSTRAEPTWTHIAHRRQSVFPRECAMLCYADLLTANTWCDLPGRPRNKWLDQLRDDSTQTWSWVGSKNFTVSMGWVGLGWVGSQQHTNLSTESAYCGDCDSDSFYWMIMALNRILLLTYSLTVPINTLYTTFCGSFRVTNYILLTYSYCIPSLLHAFSALTQLKHFPVKRRKCCALT